MKLSWSAKVQWAAALLLTGGMLAILFQESRPPNHAQHNEVIRQLHEADQENAFLIQESLRLRMELT